MIARFIYELTDPPLAFFLLYLTIVILMAIAYKLGFARPLPVLKQVVVYLILALGCLILAFMAYAVPIADILVVIVLALAIVRYRMST